MRCTVAYLLLTNVLLCNTGLKWTEVLDKYRKQALQCLGEGANEDDVTQFVYRRIVERACSTSAFFDRLAEHGYWAALTDTVCGLLAAHGDSSADCGSDVATAPSSGAGSALLKGGREVAVMFLTSSLLGAVGVK
jgi:hypothetical protein